MKIIFYRTLLKHFDGITPSEKILYSFLVSKSISRIDDVYNKDGSTVDMELLYDYLHDNNYYCELCVINNTKISKHLHQTRKTVITGINNLKKLGYIGDDWIHIDRHIVENGYFTLENIDKIKGDLLIFYSFIRDKSLKYGYHIDTYKRGLSQQIFKSKTSVTKMLQRLYKIGLVERLNDGRLFIK
jgi:predicted transcriptional regulator